MTIKNYNVTVDGKAAGNLQIDINALGAQYRMPDGRTHMNRPEADFVSAVAWALGDYEARHGGVADAEEV